MFKTIEIITSNTKYPAPFTHRVLILCEEKNIPYFLTKIDTENKPAWFLEMAPLGLVPVMRIENQVIPDSHAICEYLDKGFSSVNSKDLEFADQLSEFIASKVKVGNIQQANLDDLKNKLQLLSEKIILPYFYGKQLSLVDIYLISHLLWLDALEEAKILLPLIHTYPTLSSWIKTMKTRDSVKKTMGPNFGKNFIELLRNYKLI